MIRSHLISILVLIVFEVHGFAQKRNPPEYIESKNHGWTVHTNVVLNSYASLLRQTDSALALELGTIEQILPKSELDKLKEVGIWVELKSRNGVPIQYHTSADWLRENGDNPQKERSIELQAADYSTQPVDSLQLLWYFATAYE